jgi:hypothetical protein
MLKCAITCFAALTNCTTVVALHTLHCTLRRDSPAYAHTQCLANTLQSCKTPVLRPLCMRVQIKAEHSSERQNFRDVLLGGRRA